MDLYITGFLYIGHTTAGVLSYSISKIYGYTEKIVDSLSLVNGRK